MRSLKILLCGLIVLSLFTGASAQESTLSIVNYSLTPEVLMPGDRGTLEVTLKNTGTSPLKITGASLYGAGLKSEYVNYQHIGWVGAQETITLTFPISAGEVEDGSYYPQVVISIEGGESVVFPIHVKVDSSSPELHLVEISSSAPFSIVKGEEAEITLEIVNPRDSSVNSVVVEPEIPNAEILPERAFVGTLDAHSSEKISFTLKASENFSESSLKFRMSFRNGENQHETLFEFPIKVIDSASSLRLIPVETRIMGSTSDEIEIEIDVANSLRSEISSVSVISLSEKTSPKEYYIGRMNPDDVFTARFKVSGSAVNGTEVFGFKAIYVEDGVQKETPPVYVTVTAVPQSPKISPALYLIALLIIIGAAIYLRRRRK